jgi:hypothetical protein
LYGAAETPAEFDRAKNIILLGLIAQLVFFGLFIVLITIFHYRIVRQPTERSTSTAIPWRRYILILYVTAVMILLRSVFRLVEYQGGRGNVTQTKEVFFYVFDSVLMYLVAAIFNVLHPSKIVSRDSSKREAMLMNDMSADRVDRLV